MKPHRILSEVYDNESLSRISSDSAGFRSYSATLDIDMNHIERCAGSTDDLANFATVGDRAPAISEFAVDPNSFPLAHSFRALPVTELG